MDKVYIWHRNSDGLRIGTIYLNDVWYNGIVPYKTGVKQYAAFIAQGWKPMSLEDIQETSRLRGIPLVSPDIENQ